MNDKEGFLEEMGYEGKPKPYIMPERIKKLLEEGKLWDNVIVNELNKKHIGDIKTKEIIFTSCMGRLVKNKRAYSFNDIVLSTSSAGKDHVVRCVLEYSVPREHYETWGRTSTKTFNYLHNLEDEPEHTYDGKIVYLKEITEGILNNEVMKEFTSAEEEISQIAIPRGATKDKAPSVDIIQIRGHPVVITTTATSIPSDEIRNRFNILGCDESEEQTKRARINKAESYSEDVRDFVHNLKMYDVEIPDKLFRFIDKHFPTDKVRYRRDFPKFLDFVRAVTIFHQYLRRKYKGDILRATYEDYNLARDIFINAYSKLSNVPLKVTPKKIVQVFENSDIPLTAREVFERLDGYLTIQNLYPHLNNLKAKEILEEITDKDDFGRPLSKYILSEEFKDKKPFKLPIYKEGD